MAAQRACARTLTPPLPQVSCTVTFNPTTEGPQIKHALEYFQYHLKGVSFLPNETHNYAQLPYEAISADVYAARIAQVRAVCYDGSVAIDAVPELFCDGDHCAKPGSP